MSIDYNSFQTATEIPVFETGDVGYVAQNTNSSSIYEFAVSSDTNNNYLIIDISSRGAVSSTTVFITKGEYLRLQNAADRIQEDIYIVGSRANGTATPSSDWDYIIPNINNRKWKKIKNSIPGAKTIDHPRNIDIVHLPLNPNMPYIRIAHK